MAVNSILFDVVGRPAPQGSKKHVGGGRFVEASKHLPAWRKAVTLAAKNVYSGDPFTDPVRVRIVFRLEKPKSTKYDFAPAGKPDIDKLVRGCFDALSGVCFVDDAQVVSVEADKVWADDQPGATIHVVTVT